MYVHKSILKNSFGNCSRFPLLCYRIESYKLCLHICRKSQGYGAVCYTQPLLAYLDSSHIYGDCIFSPVSIEYGACFLQIIYRLKNMILIRSAEYLILVSFYRSCHGYSSNKVGSNCFNTVG